MSERASPDSRTIAVLIPVFNDDGQLDSTLRSIEDQGVPVVVVIVDDGSDKPVVVRHPAGQEIVVLRHDVNRGIAHALNTGLAFIVDREIPYVARIDNGDRCAPGRLARQRDFLEQNPSVHVVGSAVEWRDDAGRSRFTRVFPTTHERIVRALPHTTALAHAAVMFRTSVVHTVGMYSTAYSAAQDLDFFRRIARQHQVANLPETLVVARFDPAGISIRRRRAQLWSTFRIQLAFFRPLAWTSYYGLLKTLVRYVVPNPVIVAVKGALSRRARAQSI